MTAEPTHDAVQQARALIDGAGLRVRGDLVEVEVVGDDARSWLNGQVTNDVRHTQAGQAVYALVASVKGRIMADAWVLDRGEVLSILLPRAAAEEVLQRFDTQIIMEDVELQTLTDHTIVSVQGPAALEAVAAAGLGDDAFPCDELGTGGALLRVASADLAATLQALRAAHPDLVDIDAQGLELACLRLSRPRFGVDFDDTVYPQEAGLKARAVSFNKGCYLGQEVIHTLEHRGKLSRELRALSADGDPGDTVEITDADGKTLGRITSATVDPETKRWLGLGYVRRAALEAGTPLLAGDTALSLRD